MRRLAFAVIAATLGAACEPAPSSSGSAEIPIIRTEVVDPATIPPPPAPTFRKRLLTDPPPPAPVVIAEPVDEPVDPTAPADAPTSGKGGLELISAGVEPLYPLQYQATKGAQEALAMTMAMTMSMPPNPAIIFPEMVVEADAVATSVAADGAMTLELTLTDADVRDVPGSQLSADQVRAQMGDVVGMKTTMIVDAHGRMSDVQGAAIQQMQQTQLGFDQLVVPLPEVPVGKGAKWKISQPVVQGALKLKQIVTYEILAVTATTAKIRARGRMSAPRQKIDWNGAEVDLEKTTGTMDVTMTIDFTRLVPKVRGSVEMTMKMNANGEQATMTTKSTMTMRAK